MKNGELTRKEAVQAVREKAEALAGTSLGECGNVLAGVAVQRALAYCQREDLPEDMEQAAAVLLLALAGQFSPCVGESEKEEAAGEHGIFSGTALREPGAGDIVKSIQRGDTTITFDTSLGRASGGSGLSGSTVLGASFPGEAAALAGLNPWRRLGRLKKEVL